MGVKMNEYTKVYVFLPISIFALILLTVGAFGINWWEQSGVLEDGEGGRKCRFIHPPREFLLWEKINCAVVKNQYLCILNTVDNTDWLLFVRCMTVLATFLVSSAILSHFGFLCLEKKVLRFFSTAFSTAAGVVCFITSFVILGMFHMISNALRNQTDRGEALCEYLRYRTLPVAFIFFAGFLCNFVAVGLTANFDKPKTKVMVGFGNTNRSAPLRKATNVPV